MPFCIFFGGMNGQSLSLSPTNEQWDDEWPFGNSNLSFWVWWNVVWYFWMLSCVWSIAHASNVEKVIEDTCSVATNYDYLPQGFSLPLSGFSVFWFENCNWMVVRCQNMSIEGRTVAVCVEDGGKSKIYFNLFFVFCMLVLSIVASFPFISTNFGFVVSSFVTCLGDTGQNLWF